MPIRILSLNPARILSNAKHIVRQSTEEELRQCLEFATFTGESKHQHILPQINLCQGCFDMFFLDH